MESMVIITRIMTRHVIIMLPSGYVAEMQEEETTRIAACVGKEDVSVSGSNVEIYMCRT